MDIFTKAVKISISKNKATNKFDHIFKAKSLMPRTGRPYLVETNCLPPSQQEE